MKIKTGQNECDVSDHVEYPNAPETNKINDLFASFVKLLGKWFSFTRIFNTRMWIVTGALLGLIAVSLYISVGAIFGLQIQYGFIAKARPVYLLAASINLLIILCTITAGYLYRNTDEYKAAVTPAENIKPEKVYTKVSKTGENRAVKVRSENKDGVLSDEAAEIMAELEKLSLSL